MILDFKANKIFIGVSILVAFGLATYLRLNDTGWGFIALITLLFTALTYFQLKRNTLKFIQNYEVVLMIRLQSEPYVNAYQALVDKGTRFNPVWTITKHQRLAMGHVFTGSFDKAKDILATIEKEYQSFLELDSYSFYLNQVIYFLLALLTGEKIKEATLKEKEAFSALPIKAQERLKDNPNGYHQLAALAGEVSEHKNPQEILIKAFKERSNFMKVILAKAYHEELLDQEVPENQLF